MDKKKNQSLIIPFIVITVCLLAFGIPFLFSLRVDDSRDDLVVSPRSTPTSTPVDRVLTQQAFANLFATVVNPLVLILTPAPTSTETFVAAILITGPTATLSPTSTHSPTPTRTLFSLFPTRTQSEGGVGFPSATATRPPPTNTAIVVVTITSTPVSPVPPTDTPVPPPTATPEPPTPQPPTPEPPTPEPPTPEP